MKKNGPTSKTGILSLALLLVSTGAATVQTGHWKEGGAQVAVGIGLILVYEYLQAKQIEASFIESVLGQSGEGNDE